MVIVEAHFPPASFFWVISPIAEFLADRLPLPLPTGPPPPSPFGCRVHLLRRDLRRRDASSSVAPSASGWSFRRHRCDSGGSFSSQHHFFGLFLQFRSFSPTDCLSLSRPDLRLQVHLVVAFIFFVAIVVVVDESSSVAPSASEPSFRHCCCLWFVLIGCLVFVLLSVLSLTRILVPAVWETYPENRCEASVLAVSRADRLSLISGCVTPQRTRQESRWCLGTGNSGI